MTRARRRRSTWRAVVPWLLASGMLVAAGALFRLHSPAVATTPADVRAAAIDLPAAPLGNSVADSPAPSIPPPSITPASMVGADIVELRRRKLPLPVDGVLPAQLVPSFHQARGQHEHEALDILAPRGTAVIAVENGRIAKLFTSIRGGLTVYLFDPSETYCYYYAHLDRYEEHLHEGDRVARGDVLGYVGTTGNAPPETPHLHFAIFKLGPEKRWWQGTALDPYLVWAGP
jgi:murein DD-endopeptidase MepM/ murein hydrolase activator NlpD